jgi:hypothetical protein
MCRLLLICTGMYFCIECWSQQPSENEHVRSIELFPAGEEYDSDLTRFIPASSR